LELDHCTEINPTEVTDALPPIFSTISFYLFTIFGNSLSSIFTSGFPSSDFFSLYIIRNLFYSHFVCFFGIEVGTEEIKGFGLGVRSL
jgi:hypothetical protein